MSMQILEGTWEDILRRSAELKGHAVRVEVLERPHITEESNEYVTAEDWVKSFRLWAEGHDRSVPLLSDEHISRGSIYGEQ